MSTVERLWLIAGLARVLVENDGAGAQYDAAKALKAREALRDELDRLEPWKIKDASGRGS